GLHREANDRLRLLPAVLVVAAVLLLAVATAAATGRRRVVATAAIAQHLDDHDRRLVVGLVLRRLAGLLGRRRRVVGDSGQRRVRGWWGFEPCLRAGGLRVVPVLDDRRHENEIMTANARRAEIDGAAGRDQGDVALGRILSGQRDQRGDAGAARRYGGRERGVAVAVVAEQRRGEDRRGLRAAAGVDIAGGGPGENVAAEGRHDAALAEQDAAERIDVDRAVASLRDQAGAGSRGDAFHAEDGPPARIQHLDGAAVLGADAGIGEIDIAQVVLGKAAEHRQPTRIVDRVALGVLVGEQRRDRLAAAQIALVARSGRIVVLTAAE
ncbi:hypothetical protein NS44R_14545, partial [Mammaliicoccus sciuri]